MQINSPDQLDLARRVLRAYGNDWSKLRANSTRGDDGVLYVQPITPRAPVARQSLRAAPAR